MEISSITGPDAVPSGFSSERPRTEEAAERERKTEEPRERAPEERGGAVDTYA